jgi:hypothetical protein
MTLAFSAASVSLDVLLKDIAVANLHTVVLHVLQRIVYTFYFISVSLVQLPRLPAE